MNPVSRATPARPVPTGPRGPKGDNGEQGPAGADGSDATRLGVLDADGNRLGDYLAGAGRSGNYLTILKPSDGRIYALNPHTGAYTMPHYQFYWGTSDCSGPAYVETAELPQEPFVQDRDNAGIPGDQFYVASTAPQTITYRSTLTTSSYPAGTCRGIYSWTGTAYPVEAVGTIPADVPAPLRVG